MDLKAYESFSGIYGECRCCLTKGTHVDLFKDHYFEGKREVYGNIFIECFNLFLCDDTRLPPLICKSCVKKLKDAHNFKMAVMNVETKMLGWLSHPERENTAFVNGAEDMKDEIIKLRWNNDTGIEIEENEVYSDGTDNSLLVPDTTSVNGEKALIARFPRNAIAPLPTRAALNTICPGYMKHLEELKGKEIKARMIQEMLNEPTRVRRKSDESLRNKQSIDLSKTCSPMSEKRAHVANIATLIENSNLTAFMTKFKNGYPCFYCKKIFVKFDDLRDHQMEHSKDNIQKMLLKRYKKGRPDSLVVYVDVKDLKCTLCGLNITTLNDLKSHLTKEHKKTILSNYSDRVIPFRISDKYLCQVCSFNFETFGAIERHMNVHYRNFVCETCGAGFISKHRLKIHTYNIHSSLQGRFPCEICKKIYPTHRKLRIHNDYIHKMAKNLKCPKCPMRFSYYYVRQKHLLDVHGDAPVVYKCNVCEKEFKRRYPLSIHIKKEHLSQGDFICEICSYSCFSRNELKVHLVKKHGDKIVGKAKEPEQVDGNV